MLGLGHREWDSDDLAVVDADRAEAAGSFVEVEGGEVDEGADLVLGLEHVCPIGAGSDGAIRARDSIFP